MNHASGGAECLLKLIIGSCRTPTDIENGHFFPIPRITADISAQ